MRAPDPRNHLQPAAQHTVRKHLSLLSGAGSRCAAAAARHSGGTLLALLPTGFRNLKRRSHDALQGSEHSAGLQYARHHQCRQKPQQQPRTCAVCRCQRCLEAFCRSPHEARHIVRVIRIQQPCRTMVKMSLD